MKKILIIIITLLCLFLGGCETSNNGPNSGNQITSVTPSNPKGFFGLKQLYDQKVINDETLDTIYNIWNHNVSFDEQLDEETIVKIKNDYLNEFKELEIYRSISHKEVKLEDIHINGYYGKYNNVYFISFETNYDESSYDLSKIYERIGKYIFYYDDKYLIGWCDKNINYRFIYSQPELHQKGPHYSLKYAYVNGIISDTDLDIIYKIWSGEISIDEQLDSDTVFKIKINGHVAKVLNGMYSIEDALYWKTIIRYLGNYNGAYVFYSTTRDMYQALWVDEVIGDYLFSHDYRNNLYVWYEGEVDEQNNTHYVVEWHH